MRLVYLSPVPLASFAQRPHHFVRWFHDRHRGEVLWIEPYPARLPGLRDLRRLGRRAGGDLGPIWAGEPWIERLHLPSVPFEPLAPGRAINRMLWRGALARLDRFVDADTWLVAGKACALGMELARRYPGNPLVLDVMDNVPAFTRGLSRQWLGRVEALLAQRSDTIITASTPLHEKFAQHRHKSRCIRNGLTPLDDADAPLSARVAPDPFVFGYLGSIADWFDWDAVNALAHRYPNCLVRLIGPCERPPPRLPPNVELLPAIAQHRVYEALRGFSVGLIPFEVNELTDCVDPVKYYEYRAMGLPVLSTRFGEMRLRGDADHVLFFDELGDATDLPEMLRAACDPEEVIAFRDANTWARRFDALDPFAPG